DGEPPVLGLSAGESEAGVGAVDRLPPRLCRHGADVLPRLARAPGAAREPRGVPTLPGDPAYPTDDVHRERDHRGEECDHLAPGIVDAGAAAALAIRHRRSFVRRGGDDEHGPPMAVDRSAEAL